MVFTSSKISLTFSPVATVVTVLLIANHLDLDRKAR